MPPAGRAAPGRPAFGTGFAIKPVTQGTNGGIRPCPLPRLAAPCRSARAGRIRGSRGEGRHGRRTQRTHNLARCSGRRWSAGAPLHPAVGPDGGRSRMKVLVADDNLPFRRALEAALADWGFEAVGVADGVAAWEALRQVPAPELAILDWTMPGLDGLEVCRRVRALPGAGLVYLILLPAHRDPADLLAGAVTRCPAAPAAGTMPLARRGISDTIGGGEGLPVRRPRGKTAGEGLRPAGFEPATLGFIPLRLSSPPCVRGLDCLFAMPSWF